MTRAQAAEYLRHIAEEQVKLVEMVERDLREQPDFSPSSLEAFANEHEVRRAVARFLKLKAAVLENTCRKGSCEFKLEDLAP